MVQNRKIRLYHKIYPNLFLEKRFGDKPAHCDIVAYTSQTQMATALCFVDGELINKALVEAGLAENVALK